MKKFFLVIIALAIFQKWDDINAFINPPPNYGAVHDKQVILYATDWCGYCQKARELMEKHNISYYEYDIEKSEEGRKQHKALGGNGVPVLVIDGEIIRGYNPSKILELADKT